MAECINCGEYTKFNGGVCYTCYKEGDKIKDTQALNQKTKKNYKQR